MSLEGGATQPQLIAKVSDLTTGWSDSSDKTTQFEKQADGSPSLIDCRIDFRKYRDNQFWSALGEPLSRYQALPSQFILANDGRGLPTL